MFCRRSLLWECAAYPRRFHHASITRAAPMIRAAIFDLDGTLVDSNELHVEAWDEAFRHFGKIFPREKLRKNIGKGGDQYLPEFLNEFELRTIGPQIDKYRSKLFIEKYRKQVRPFPKVRELFER